jgi:uncharacterized phage protein gp47/JayE
VATDVSGYVDLALYDLDEQGLVERALGEITARFPDWVPREGNTEMVLLESTALMVAELAYAINRVPGAVVEVLLRLYGLTRDPGTGATATARLYTSDTTGRTIPAGTRVRLVLPPDIGSVDFATDTDLVVPVGASSGVVGVTATTAGAFGANAPAGTALAVITAVAYLERAELASPVISGRDPENDVGLLQRGSALLSRLVTTLVLPAHFTAAAAEEAAVSRATTLDNYNPNAGSGVPGDHPGHVTVAVTGPDGAALSTSDKNALDLRLEGMALAGLAVHVIDATVTAVNVTVSVVRDPTADDAAVTTSVQNALVQFLDPDTWAWGGTVWHNELLSIIDRADGVSRVVSLSAPASDLTLPGVAPLAALGTVNVTVVAP